MHHVFHKPRPVIMREISQEEKVAKNQIIEDEDYPTVDNPAAHHKAMARVGAGIGASTGASVGSLIGFTRGMKNIAGKNPLRNMLLNQMACSAAGSLVGGTLGYAGGRYGGAPGALGSIVPGVGTAAGTAYHLYDHKNTAHTIRQREDIDELGKKVATVMLMSLQNPVDTKFWGIKEACNCDDTLANQAWVAGVKDSMGLCTSAESTDVMAQSIGTKLAFIMLSDMRDSISEG